MGNRLDVACRHISGSPLNHVLQPRARNENILEVTVERVGGSLECLEPDRSGNFVLLYAVHRLRAHAHSLRKLGPRHPQGIPNCPYPTGMRPRADRSTSTIEAFIQTLSCQAIVAYHARKSYRL